MEFCPKCGALLIQKVKNSGCPRCGYTKKGSLNLSIKEKVEGPKEVAVLKKDMGSTAPIVNEDCPECGHDKALF